MVPTIVPATPVDNSQSPKPKKSSKKKKFKMSFSLDQEDKAAPKRKQDDSPRRNTDESAQPASHEGEESKKHKKPKKKKGGANTEQESETKPVSHLEGTTKKQKKQKRKKGGGETEQEPDTKKARVAQQEPEVKGKKTKRNKKKKKIGEAEEHIHQSAGQNKALRYLQTWNLSQTGDTSATWKFEKCRQIWLLQNAYDCVKIGDEEFDVLLKYMCSIRGQMRDKAKGQSSNCSSTFLVQDSYSKFTSRNCVSDGFYFSSNY